MQYRVGESHFPTDSKAPRPDSELDGPDDLHRIHRLHDLHRLRDLHRLHGVSAFRRGPGRRRPPSTARTATAAVPAPVSTAAPASGTSPVSPDRKPAISSANSSGAAIRIPNSSALVRFDPAFSPATSRLVRAETLEEDFPPARSISSFI